MDSFYGTKIKLALFPIGSWAAIIIAGFLFGLLATHVLHTSGWYALIGAGAISYPAWWTKNLVRRHYKVIDMYNEENARY